ncbi:MAG: hypothetical protein FH762_08020 [Firmicutes bacterium]|nr:hypothetical protein [Bacillota bacterium]
MVVREKKKIGWPVIILIILAPFILRFAVGLFTGHDLEDVQRKIEEHLYQKYGEEFVVTQIGTRSSRGEEFYQARIYPESIIGTNREWDDYYCASATISKRSFGKLGGVGDSYSYVNRNMDLEKYLLPEIKNIFRERVLIKVDVAHEVTGDGSWWAGYKSVSLEEMRKDIAEDPERNRIILDLDVYIFDRIENEEEKEERRKEIFELVQYLKEEGLFEYLSLVIKIVDEKSLTPSYRSYKRKLDYSNKETVKINGIKVELPPKKLINEMSQVLGKELREQSEEDLINNMNRIKKSEMGIDGIEGYLEQYFIRIVSIDMMKIQGYGEYEEEKEKGRLEEHKYLKKEDIRLGKENLKYIFRK